MFDNLPSDLMNFYYNEWFKWFNKCEFRRRNASWIAQNIFSYETYILLFYPILIYPNHWKITYPDILYDKEDKYIKHQNFNNFSTDIYILEN